MVDVGYTTEGLAQCLNALKRLENVDVDQRLRAVRQEVAQMVMATARATVPNKTKRSTGATAAAHTAHASKWASVIMVSKRQAPQAGPVHFGAYRNIRRVKHPRTPGGPIMGNPWLINAAKSSESRWEQMVANTVDALLEELASGSGR